jgi:benzylsuccinate CoA-transferase BbsF subunit
MTGEPRHQPAPLEGIRVVDFTWAWAGPHGTLLLAMLGAEVIKVESATRLDHSRVRSLMAGAVGVGPDASPLFNHLNLGKRSLTLDLHSAPARDLVRRLVAVSDVVVQNMRPGVLDRLGLGYEQLAATKPDLVMLSSSAVGATGPESAYAGYAPTFAALSGAADLTGYPDGPPIPLSGSVDLRVGTASTLAVLAALYHREATGEGQHIDLSSTEVMSWMVGETFLELSISGRVPRRMGNRHARMAPHGCYRCRGQRAWVSIAVDGDDEWIALKRVLANARLEDAAFADRDSRWRHQDRLDPLIEAWTMERDPEQAAATLRAAGVSALPVLDAPALVDDAHLREREVFGVVDHPVIGKSTVVSAPWRFDGARPAVDRPAPLLGQHNRYVLEEVLGLSAAEIAGLEDAGALT